VIAGPLLQPMRLRPKDKPAAGYWINDPLGVDNLKIRVTCRVDDGALEETAPYALMTFGRGLFSPRFHLSTFIYRLFLHEVRVRVYAARVQVAPSAGHDRRCAVG
jgi:hypothetical protein